MRELDTLMSNWLDKHYHDATEAERGAFEELLSWQDPELISHINRIATTSKLPQTCELSESSQSSQTPTQQQIQIIATAKERDLENVLEQIRSLTRSSG